MVVKSQSKDLIKKYMKIVDPDNVELPMRRFRQQYTATLGMLIADGKDSHIRRLVASCWAPFKAVFRSHVLRSTKLSALM